MSNEVDSLCVLDGMAVFLNVGANDATIFSIEAASPEAITVRLQIDFSSQFRKRFESFVSQQFPMRHL